MDYLNPQHPFFSVANIKKVLALIEQRILEETGDKILFEANDRFVEEMYQAGRDYTNYLITADPQEGVGKLNDLMARRALRALTETEEAGQYVPGNYLYKLSRKTRREDDGVRDHDRQASALILGGNIYKKHNDKFQQMTLDMQQEYLNNPNDLKFAPTKPRMYLDAQFRELQ